MVKRKPKYALKLCLICGQEFSPASPLQKTCAGVCRDENRRTQERVRDHQKRILRKLVCPLCGCAFETRDSKRIYCGSSDCEARRVYRKNYRGDQKRRGLRHEYKCSYYGEHRDGILSYKKDKYRADRPDQVVVEGPSTARVTYAEVCHRFAVDGYTVVSEEQAYVSTHVKVLVECPAGHRWWIEPNSFRGGRRCPECSPRDGQSGPEKAITAYFSEKYPLLEIVTSERALLSPQELDIYFPEQHVAVEYCGLYWHGEVFSGKKHNYHRKKFEGCRRHGIRLLTIFEDEYLQRPDVVLSRIECALGLGIPRVFARKCRIGQVDSWLATEFFDKTHLQGKTVGLVSFGLFFNETLIQVLSLGALSRSHAGKGGKYIELKRLASLPGLVVVGGASRLFAAAKKWAREQGYTHIKSYCDMRWANPFKPVYECLGFELVGETKYTPHYFRGQTRYRNQSLRKTPEERLSGKTEWQLRQEQGFDRIWDCGHRTYLYTL